MLCRLTGNPPTPAPSHHLTKIRMAKSHPPRYEIETGGPGWEEAEAQVQRAVKAKGDKADVTVSVRSSKAAGEKKRKKGESAEKIYAEEIGDKAAKRLKKGMKDRGR